MKNYVGIDIGGTKMYMVSKVNGEYVERKIPTGVHCTKECIKAAMDDFIATLPFSIDGIGMALPGLVIEDHTLEISDVVPSLNGVTTDYFSEGRFPLRFLNDVKAATLAEASHYDKKDTVAVLMVGTGIAIGVYSEGIILKGAAGFAGEIGHAYFTSGDKPQMLDELSSGAAILKMADCSADELLSRLDSGDSTAHNIIQSAGYHFGMALSVIINLYNPNTIVVGGSTSTYPGYLEKAKETAEKYALKELADCCQIFRPVDAKRIVALGAIEFLK